MKRIRINGIAPALAAGITLQIQTATAQVAGSPHSAFYRPLTLAPAETDASGGGAGAGAESNEQLAKHAQNPVAKLISAPFQNNFNFGIGPNNVCQHVLNLRPAAYYNVFTPKDFGAGWQLRFQLQFLFPKSLPSGSKTQ